MFTPFDFSGAAAVVVGGASGLGYAIAEALAGHGADVCIVARTEEKVQLAADRIRTATGRPCFTCVSNFQEEASIVALGESVAERFGGGVNIAVNCAGINVRNPIEKISLEEYEQIQRVNSTGAFLFARTIYPLLKQSGWGRLIHITSIFSSRSFPHRVSYASSKGALLQLTRTLAIEWAREGITVNAISPGPIATDMMAPVISDPKRADEFLRRIPIGRFGQPNEVATAALYLASKASAFVTGSEVVVDGGWMVA